MHVRWHLAGMLALATACSSAGKPDALTCEDAAEQVSPALRPAPLDRSGPIEVGEEDLPILRMRRPQRTPDDLAARARALACVLTDDTVKATPALFAWAEEASDAEDFTEALAFDDPKLVAIYRPDGPDSVEVRFPLGTYFPDDVDPELSPDPGIGRDAAFEIALQERDQLIDIGIIDADSFSAQTSYEGQVVTGGSEGSWVNSYAFEFRAHPGEIALLGPSLRIDVTRDGSVKGIVLRELDASEEGTAAPTVDSAQASALFHELVEAQYGLDAQYVYEDEYPAYVLSYGETDGAYEVRWFGIFAVNYNDTAGRPNFAALSMVNPDVGLVDLFGDG